jgi:tetratricopeptide (TPR) repeat protein
MSTLPPSPIDPRFEDAQALRAAGRKEEARELLLALAAEFPDDGPIQYAAACVHDSLGLEEEAVPFYLAALRAGLPDDDRRGAYLGLGSTYRALGRYTESRDTFEEGLTHFPGAAELRAFLAMTRYNLGMYHAAVAGLLEVLADTSADPAVRSYERAIRFYAENLDQMW